MQALAVPPHKSPDEDKRPRVNADTAAGREALERIFRQVSGSYTSITEVALQVVAEAIEAGKWPQTPQQVAQRIRDTHRQRTHDQGRRRRPRPSASE